MSSEKWVKLQCMSSRSERASETTRKKMKHFRKSMCSGEKPTRVRERVMIALLCSPAATSSLRISCLFMNNYLVSRKLNLPNLNKWYTCHSWTAVWIQRNEKYLKNSVLKKIARMASEEKQEVKWMSMLNINKRLYIQLFRERLSENGARSNPERYYGIWSIHCFWRL